jgi:hypothetical protein
MGARVSSIILSQIYPFENFLVEGKPEVRIRTGRWIFTRIEPHKLRLNNDIGRTLGAYLDEAKAKGQPIKLARMKCTSKAVRMLFDELVKAIVK